MNAELHTYQTPAQRRRASRNKFLRNVFYALAAFFAFVCLLSVLIPAVLDAAERESQWREERLCRIYQVCDPKGNYIDDSRSF